jgi:hypothetical protein
MSPRSGVSSATGVANGGATIRSYLYNRGAKPEVSDTLVKARGMRTIPEGAVPFFYLLSGSNAVLASAAVTYTLDHFIGATISS